MMYLIFNENFINKNETLKYYFTTFAKRGINFGRGRDLEHRFGLIHNILFESIECLLTQIKLNLV